MLERAAANQIAMKWSSGKTIRLQVALLLVGNLLAAAQENVPESASRERENQPFFFINNAPKAADSQTLPITRGGQESGPGPLIRSSFAPGVRLVEESAARQQQRQIQRQLSELVDEALDEQRKQRQQQQQQMQSPRVVVNRRALFEQLQQLSRSYNTNNNDPLPQGRAGDGEQPTRLLMLRQLEGLATPLATRTRTGEAERKRRVLGLLPSHSHGRGLISLNTQQLSALQSLNSLMGPNPASVYKPKIISTARGFGK